MGMFHSPLKSIFIQQHGLQSTSPQVIKKLCGLVTEWVTLATYQGAMLLLRSNIKVPSGLPEGAGWATLALVWERNTVVLQEMDWLPSPWQMRTWMHAYSVPRRHGMQQEAIELGSWNWPWILRRQRPMPWFPIQAPLEVYDWERVASYLLYHGSIWTEQWCPPPLEVSM